MGFNHALLLIVAVTSLSTLCGAQNSVADYLSGHNIVRAEVGVPPLVWNTTLVAYAENYVRTRLADCALVHSHGPYGENIYMGSGDLDYTSAAAAVKWWADEKAIYDYNSNQCSHGKDCLHYTQMVWRNTTSLGCARLKCANDWWYTLCSYYPPGNFWGEWPY